MSENEGELFLDSESAFRVSETFNNLVITVENSDGKAVQKFIQFQNSCLLYKKLHIVDRVDSIKIHYLTLAPFNNLTELYLHMCPPSTVIDLLYFRKQLEVLVITSSGIPDLGSLFCPSFENTAIHINDLALAPMILNEAVQKSKFISQQTKDFLNEHGWKSLRKFVLCNCGIARLDQSMHFFPSVEVLNLSKNDLSHLTHLQDCHRLYELNLSHNRLKILSNISLVLGNIVRLNLSWNFIRSLDGLDKLYSLEFLDVSNNQIDDFMEINHLRKLPCLEEVILQNNPIHSLLNYRYLVYHQFLSDKAFTQSTRQIPALDGRQMSVGESKIFRWVKL
jgi:hypothetical protein